jgi:FMN phosphatase YigB (HAD superfamily)
MSADNVPVIEVVFFDFGGVLAEEGFYNGLRTIAAQQGLDPDDFFHLAVERLFATGYIVGAAGEATWWEELRRYAGIRGSDESLRLEILSRFLLKGRMFEIVEGLKALGMRLAVLSDQTNWLDELEQSFRFSQHFERVFNSYHEKLHKRDPVCFRHALQSMGVAPENALFIDDAKRNVVMAHGVGIHAIHYENQERFEQELLSYIPELQGFML